MKCPVCTTVELMITVRQGIGIDYCPHCRSIWLDRGELDKIIERSTATPHQQPEPQRSHFGSSNQSTSFKYSRDSHNSHDRHAHGHHNKYHKKKSLFSELFDF